MIFYSGILDIANEISKYILKKEGNALVVVVLMKVLVFFTSYQINMVVPHNLFIKTRKYDIYSNKDDGIAFCWNN